VDKYLIGYLPFVFLGITEVIILKKTNVENFYHLPIFIITDLVCFGGAYWLGKSCKLINPV